MAALCLYVCTDFLFRMDDFEGQWNLIPTYYGLHLVPLILASLPILTFISQALLESQLRSKKEWHLSRLMRRNSFTFIGPMIQIALIIFTAWFGSREVIYPVLQPQLQNIDTLINGEQEFFIIVEEGPRTGIIKGVQADTISWQVIQNHQLSTTQTLTWNPETGWNLPQGQWMPQSLNPEWISQHYLQPEKNIFQLWKTAFEKNLQGIETIFLFERLLIPILFIMMFISSNLHAQKIQKHHWATVWPLINLGVFSFIMIQMRFSSMNLGLPMGLLITFASAALWFTFSPTIAKKIQ
jgi:hypothetical protein